MKNSRHSLIFVIFAICALYTATTAFFGIVYFTSELFLICFVLGIAEICVAGYALYQTENDQTPEMSETKGVMYVIVFGFLAILLLLNTVFLFLSDKHIQSVILLNLALLSLASVVCIFVKKYITRTSSLIRKQQQKQILTNAIRTQLASLIAKCHDDDVRHTLLSFKENLDMSANIAQAEDAEKAILDLLTQAEAYLSQDTEKAISLLDKANELWAERNGSGSIKNNYGN